MIQFQIRAHFYASFWMPVRMRSTRGRNAAPTPINQFFRFSRHGAKIFDFWRKRVLYISMGKSEHPDCKNNEGGSERSRRFPSSLSRALGEERFLENGIFVTKWVAAFLRPRAPKVIKIANFPHKCAAFCTAIRILSTRGPNSASAPRKLDF